MNVELLKGKDREKAEELVFAELEKLAAEPVTDAELNRRGGRSSRPFVFGRESVHSLADPIARHEHVPRRRRRGEFYQDYLDASWRSRRRTCSGSRSSTCAQEGVRRLVVPKEAREEEGSEVPGEPRP